VAKLLTTKTRLTKGKDTTTAMTSENTNIKEWLEQQKCDMLRRWGAELRVPRASRMRKAVLVNSLEKALSDNSVKERLLKKHPPAKRRQIDNEEAPLAAKRSKKQEDTVNHLTKETAAARVIQRFFRRYVKGFINQDDFIQLERFRTGPLFRHVVGENQVYRFHPKQLVEHFVNSGMLRNPYNRTEFTTPELARLTKMNLRLDPQFPWDLVRDKGEIIRRAHEAHNLEHNTEYYEELFRHIMGRLFVQTTAGLSLLMDEALMALTLQHWAILQPLRDEYLYILFRLNRQRADNVVGEACAAMYVLETCPVYTPAFRTFVSLLDSNLQDTYERFQHLQPNENPILIEPLHRMVNNQVLPGDMDSDMDSEDGAIVSGIVILDDDDEDMDEDDDEDMDEDDDDIEDDE